MHNKDTDTKKRYSILAVPLFCLKRRIPVLLLVLFPKIPGKSGKMFHNMGVPGDLFRQPSTGKRRTQSAKRHLMLHSTSVNGAAAGLLPLFAVPIGFDASLAKTIPLFSAAGAAFAAGGKRVPVDRIFAHSPNPLLILTTKSCTLVTMVFTPRLPRSRSLLTENSDTSTL